MLYRVLNRVFLSLPAMKAAHNDDDRGQTLVEYALLLFFIALVVIAALILIGPTVSAIFQSVNDEI
jgi:Flp pilus assembly pilin Flp